MELEPRVVVVIIDGLPRDLLETTDLSVGRRLDFLNVSCTVRPNPEQEAAQVERVRATLEALG